MVSKISRGDIIEIELDNLAHGGDCVGHLDGLAVFVPGGIPGEKVRVRITQSKKNYARGELIEVLIPDKERVKPACSVFGTCGGCQLQQMDYQLQLVHKRRMVEDLLNRIGGFAEIKVNSVLGADFPWGYRNKAQFPLAVDEMGRIVIGFYQQGTHEVVPQNFCEIQHPLINKTVNRVINILNEYQLMVYDEKRHRGLLRHLVVRVGVCTDQIMLTIVTSEDKFPHVEEIAKRIMDQVPEVKGVFQNINSKKGNVILGREMKLIVGTDHYLDFIGQIKFAISPRSFFQVNTLQTKKLYDVIMRYAQLNGKEIVVDGYCGIGSISLYLACKAKKIFGIEEVPEAIADADKNAELNKLDNCSFQVGRVEDVLPKLIKQGLKPDLLIFDPPRKGLAETTIETVLSTDIRRMIYVSCNPATLARDLARLSAKYKIEEVQPVDMFPHTYHVETVVKLCRHDKD